MVTWKTAVGALAAVLALGAAAIAGLLLASRDRGLARAPHVLARLPREATAVVRLDAPALRAAPELRRALAPLWAGALGTAGPAALGTAPARVYLFGTPGAGAGILFPGSGESAGTQPPTGPTTTYQGVPLHRLGHAMNATLRGGWHVSGPRRLVEMVVDSALRKRARMPARPDFSVLQALAAQGRSHLLAQVVILGGPLLDAVARGWPAVRRARGLGIFARLEGDRASLLFALFGRVEAATATQLGAALRRLGPEGIRVAASLDTEREGDLLVLRGSASRAGLAVLARAAATWLGGRLQRNGFR